MAFRIVRRNYGCPGPDGIPIKAFKLQYHRRRDALIRKLESNSCTPSPPRPALIIDSGGRQRGVLVYNVGDRWCQEYLRLSVAGMMAATTPPYVFGYMRGRTNTQAAEYILRSMPRCVLKTDIRNFMPSVHLPTLWTLLESTGADHELVGAVRAAVCQSSGLPVGNALSPTLANLYLSAVDRAFPTGYCRFSDDMLFAVRDPAETQETLSRLRALLQPLRLSLNEEKTAIIESPTIIALL